MASSSTVSCGVCDSQHTTTNADYWCPECDEGLCSQCLKYHTASKASRNHAVISVDNYKQLPPSIANISLYCSQHDRKFRNYCPQHESLCCPLCIQSNHANCVSILSLENVIQAAKTSVLLESLDQNLQVIKMNAERAVADRKLNLSAIQSQRQKFHDEITQVRSKLNEHLDTLEQRILQDLYAAEKKVKSQIEGRMRQIAEHTEKLDLLQTNMSAIKQYASDLQTFLGSKMIETEIKKHEIYLQSLFEDDSLKKIDLNCQIEDNLSDIVSAVTSFGSISVTSSSQLVEMQTKKDKQAQTRTFSRTPAATIIDIKDIKITLKRKFDYTGITGCSFSSKGDIFLVDYNRNRLLILKEDGTLENELPLSTKPVDVTYIGDKIAAVSFPNSNRIKIINILTKKIERMIKTTTHCHGICNGDSHLFTCETSIGIQKVNVSGNCSSIVVKDGTMSTMSFVTTFQNKIFYTNYLTSTVTCCSLTGEKIWEYKDQLIRNPRGIAVDKNSNVYIASSVNQSIIVLSSDGRQARKLVGKDDGIDNSYGLAFDAKKENLLVANYNGPILYEIC